jgi:spore coat protein A
MTMSRRNVLWAAAGAAIGTPLVVSACRVNDLGDGGSGLGGDSAGKQRTSTANLPEPFGVPLPVPAVLQPSRTDATTDYYEITQRVASREILPGKQTQIWGYNGTFPGPTIVTRRGRKVVVHHRNELPLPTSVHLHGGKTPPDSDGYPTDLVLPVGGGAAGAHAAHGTVTQDAKDYSYPSDQPAATLWYHDHRMDFTGPQVWRGLAGFHLVRDDVEQGLPLPKGERDVPLMICDRAFNDDGSFWYPSIDPSLHGSPGVTEPYMKGVLGDVILVNGVPWPYLEVTNTHYRFRILNASNSRRYQLKLDPPPPSGPAFVQIGSDVGLLGAPVNQNQLEIAQAERFEVVVNFGAYPVGTQVTLTNGFGDGATGKVMQFRVTRQARDDSTIPGKLVDFERLSPSQASTRRHFDFDSRAEGWAINGKTFDPNRIDVQTPLGATEIWNLNTDTHHPFHMHMGHFQVLGRSGRGPGPYDAGWKDTVDVPTGQEVEVIARFTGYRGRFIFHCHNLEHEDMGMMANLQIV